MSFTLNVNGSMHEVNADADTPLLWVIRDIIGLTGTKYGCGIAMCGACTVHVDGQAKRSCVTPAGSVAGAAITTIEMLSEQTEGRAVQAAWLEAEVIQCGYCQSGQLMQAAALLAAEPTPDDATINAVMSGNLCRCGTYGRIRQAIHLAAADLATKGSN